MAFSQVEIVSSPTFGCVLRDHNRHDDFEKNLKVLVKKDHLRNRIPMESELSDENSQNPIDSWIKNQQQANKNNLYHTPRSLQNKKQDKFQENSEYLHLGRSENLAKSENLGASSLVQIWEARLNRSNSAGSTNQSQSTVSSSRSSSGISSTETSCSGPSIDDGSSGESESSDERDDHIKDNATTGSESKTNQMVQIESAISSDRSCSVSDSGESKWVRVADIIRRLSNDQKQANNKNNGANQLPFIKAPRPSSSTPTSTHQTAEIRSFPQIGCSLRIRGRQAFSDLLMQMERDRHQELDLLIQRHTVSKFSQRGRLQTMLRLRCLQRCLAIQDRHRANVKTAEPNRLLSESAVLHLRASVGNSATEQTDSSVGLINKTVETECSPVAAQVNEENVLLEASGTGRSSINQVKEANEDKKGEQRDKHETVSGMRRDIQEGANENNSKTSCCLHLQETREETALNDLAGEEKRKEEEDANGEQNQFLDPEDTSETMSPLHASCENPKVEEDHDSNNQQDQYVEYRETTFLNNWEENEIEEEQEYDDHHYYYGETNYDWFSEISRPRSYWEDLRKYRYLEVINSRSEHEEIRQLLERRTVSEFLESDMRERIDRLMISCTQRRMDQDAQKRISHWALTKEEEEEEEEEEVEEGQEQLGEPEEKEQEITHSCSDDFSRFSSQMFSPSPGRSWSSQDQEITSTPLLPMSHPSAEMELINELRGQMEQLQSEVAELRKSVKSCIDMNLHLQQSVNLENPLKRKCSICNEMNVDSLLYRCGHMCTCLKCAHELQWSSGKCPICSAPILDVVRVFC